MSLHRLPQTAIFIWRTIVASSRFALRRAKSVIANHRPRPPKLYCSEGGSPIADPRLLRRLLPFAICLLPFAIGLCPASAVSPYTPIRPDPIIEPWRWTVFPELSGLGLRCMAEDRDGKIWFGVRDGVMIYDGVDWVTYTPENGLIGAPVLCLLASRDGSVYAGTSFGISRYHDGKWTQTFPDQGDCLWINDIIEAPDGALWSAAQWGLLRMRDSKASIFTTEDWTPYLRSIAPDANLVIVPDHVVRKVRSTTERVASSSMATATSGLRATYQGQPSRVGSVWKLAANGPAAKAGVRLGDRIISVNGRPDITSQVVDSRPGTTVQMTVVREGVRDSIQITMTTQEPDLEYRTFEPVSILLDRNGMLWAGLQDGGVVRFDEAGSDAGLDSAWTLFDETDGLDVGGGQRLLERQNGSILLRSDKNYHGINTFDGGTWTNLSLRGIGGSDMNNAALETRDGSLWVGGASGRLHRLRQGSWSVYKAPEQPIPGHRVIDLLEAADGALWIAGMGQEAVRLDFGETRWATYEGVHYNCEGPDGSLWFVTQDNGVVRSDPGALKKEPWTRFDTRDGLMDHPRTLRWTRKHGLWAAGSHQETAATAHLKGSRWELQLHPHLAHGTNAVYESSAGDLWVGALINWRSDRGHRGGVLRYDGRSWVQFAHPDGPRYPYGIGETSDGVIWFGDFGWGLLTFNGSQWRPVSMPEDIATNVIVSRLYGTPDRGAWIGTRRHGLLHFDGSVWTQHNTRTGLSGNNIKYIAETPDGILWVTTTNGVNCYDGTSWAKRELPTGDVRIAGLQASPTGSLWLNLRVPIDGMTGLRSTRLLPENRPPETRIAVAASQVSQPGNTGLAWLASDPWRTSPTELLEFSWRLDEKAWSPFTTETNHLFELLPSGTHTFQVKARDLDFNEDPTPASVTFTVVPPVWQEPWFIGLMVVLAGAIGLQSCRVVRSRRQLRQSNVALSTANKDLFTINVSLEERTRALERERAVERIREQVQTMESSEDFERVLSLLAEDLGAAGLAFDTSAIDVLDEPVNEPTMDYFSEHGFRYTSYTIDPGGAVTSDAFNIPAPFPPVNLETIQRFIQGLPWQGRSEQTAILEVPIAGYGRLRLTASDRQDFDDDEIETLGDFAGAIALGYARFLDLKAIEAARLREMEELERELQVAHDMQMDLLPESTPEVESFDLSGICVPANHVGGDYYQYVPIGEDGSNLCIVNADVSGKAMQAATVAMRFNEMLRYEVQGRSDGVEILQGLDRSLKGQIPETMFVTCGIGILDPSQRKLSFATAANPEVYHYVAVSDEVRPLSISGCPLGLALDLGDQVPFNSTEISLSNGDLVVFTSDGVEEAQNDSEEFYEGERLANLIGELGGKGVSADDVRGAIVEDVKRFIGTAPQSDDITVIVIKATA
jgi:serine phosphatase RsbU (regulator of sigma subunit)/ligand-binding sensor domain-containing protein